MTPNLLTSITTKPGEHPTFLDRTALARACPAAFVTEPDERVSNLYQFVPTTEIIDRMETYGFKPVACSNPVTKSHRTTGKLRPSMTGPHLIRFEPVTPVEMADGCRLQAVMLNSHDRSRRFQLTAGIFRLICTNGLMVSVSTMRLTEFHLKPNMLALDERIEAALTRMHELPDVVNRWSKLELSAGAQLTFAKEAMGVRFGAKDRWSIEPKQLLAARRPADEGDDLWHVFNRVQENCTKGGIRSDRTHFSTVDIVRPRQDFAINTGLWSLAEEFAARN